MFFIDVIMGDIPIYNLTTLCLNETLSCVDFMDSMEDIPDLTTLSLNLTLSCGDFMDVRMGRHKKPHCFITFSVYRKAAFVYTTCTTQYPHLSYLIVSDFIGIY